MANHYRIYDGMLGIQVVDGTCVSMLTMRLDEEIM